MSRRRLRASLFVTSMMLAACSPTASPSPLPSSVLPSPSRTAAPGSTAPVLRDWSLIDLAAPTAPEASNGTSPTGVVAFEGRYLAVGTVWVADCSTCKAPDTPFGHPDPRADASLNRAVVWTSLDGRTWTLHDHIPALEHAALLGLLTDGRRLVAYGSYLAPHGAKYEPSIDAVWVSFDGMNWTRAPGRVPTLVAAAGPGRFVGAISTGVFGPTSTVQFMNSADGLTWTTTSPVFDAYLGGNGWGAFEGPQALVGSPTGAAMAIGTMPVRPYPNELVVWRSTDGTSWSSSETLVHSEWGGSPTIAATNDGFVAQATLLGPQTNLSDQVQAVIWRYATGESQPTRTSTIDVGGTSGGFLFAAAADALAANSSPDGLGQIVQVSTDGGRTFNDLGAALHGDWPTAMTATPDGLLATAFHLSDRQTSNGYPTVLSPEVWIGR